jgi:hypothetical protein
MLPHLRRNCNKIIYYIVLQTFTLLLKISHTQCAKENLFSYSIDSINQNFAKILSSGNRLFSYVLHSHAKQW